MHVVCTYRHLKITMYKLMLDTLTHYRLISFIIYVLSILNNV